MRSEMKGFERIAPEILSEICEDPTYARFTVYEENFPGCFVLYRSVPNKDELPHVNTCDVLVLIS